MATWASWLAWTASAALAAPQPALDVPTPIGRGQGAAATSAPRSGAAGSSGTPTSRASASVAPEDRRQVAVIDLISDEDAGALARELTSELVRHRELSPLADPTVAALLMGAVFDENAASLDAARRALADANDALARFELSVAAARAAAGQAELNNVEPRPDALALYAELAFVLGQAKLADGDGPTARSNFLLTQRLTPERELDPARYLPDVIAAYRQARRGAAGKVAIQIRGQGTAYVDGAAVGDAPLTIELEPGSHVIHLFGPKRLARGVRIEVTPTAPAVVVLPDARANQSALVARFRRAAMVATDPFELTAIIAGLARMIGVSDVVVLRHDEHGQLTAQAWRDRPPGAGLIHAVKEGDAVAASLIDLAPPKLEEASPAPRLTLTTAPKPWYRRRWVQASVVTGALAVLATAIAISARDPGTVEIDPDAGF